MADIEKTVETLKSTSPGDVVSMVQEVTKAVQTGEIMNEPNLLISLILMGTALVILLICALAFIFRKGNSGRGETPEGLEARIHTLEVALMDQRNVVANLKTQSRADLLFYKQELKNLQQALGDLAYEQSRPQSVQMKAANY